ncbi:hypothetical protein Kpol_463p5 [Vanderwaltozyma polyspora DSM 70294]|uniref:GPI-anchored wall transfer protein n=1 Tax=Vanderwaltozyma polyspora (strain ATCC 22028 / DSM 70294 / BCRC 21397 / CBS 2163 / NBRC 10782 / NRRL Y-8283 / UCD 57-17) TaxID=436907 RepID=A7TQJ2_VANPO|nr:uncharacterized protein Kpol_463p5 [Vanderwaltozyma polyspora DSM 70294]EDO15456.1 hypothetical protein Kpol_463p5 [Vanderwaltozyma polyspora DSM 70294]
MATLKQRKEDFVTGLEGGTILEINYITSIALVSYFCWNLIKNDDLNVSFEFFLDWVALLLSITTYSDSPSVLITLMLIPCLTAFFWRLLSNRDTQSGKAGSDSDSDSSKEVGYQLVKKPFITAYRGSMLIITMLAILAVDFNIFPRRFGKVETWGTSLMDLGVGSFVFSNGLVSSRGLIKEKMDPRYRLNFFKRIYNGLKSGLTLLIIGLLRLYFVKNLEYQEHVTEYGVHWNFFLTLSLLPPVLSIIDPIAEYIPRNIIAIIISIVYEWILLRDKQSMLTFLILGDRTDFFSSNREGIMSFFGYCSIFLWGQNTGFFILGNKPTKNNFYKPSAELITTSKKNITSKRSQSNSKSGSKSSFTFFDKLTTVSPLRGLISWTLIFMITTNIIIQCHPFDISRRFANISYVSWVVTYNLGFLSFYCLIDKIFNNSENNYKVSIPLEAANSNGLTLFLISNVTTGLVNMSISTIDASDSVSIVILLAYSAFLCSLSVIMYKYKIFIRL